MWYIPQVPICHVSVFSDPVGEKKKYIYVLHFHGMKCCKLVSRRSAGKTQSPAHSFPLLPAHVLPLVRGFCNLTTKISSYFKLFWRHINDVLYILPLLKADSNVFTMGSFRQKPDMEIKWNYILHLSLVWKWTPPFSVSGLLNRVISAQ